MSERDSDRGSVTIWLLGGLILLVAVVTVVSTRTLALLARHRAEAAADLAALAAAGRIGIDGTACAAGRTLAERNGAQLRACTVQLDPDGRSGTVRIRVVARVSLPIVGTTEVSASARAGRLPAGAEKTSCVTRNRPAVVICAMPPVWHADPRTAPARDHRTGWGRGW